MFSASLQSLKMATAGEQLDIETLTKDLAICAERLRINNQTNEQIQKQRIALSQALENMKQMMENYNQYEFDRATFIKIRNRLLKSGNNSELIEETEIKTYQEQIDKIKGSNYDLSIDNFMGDIIKQKLESERKQMRMEIREELYQYFEKNKVETNREFCTLLAILLVLLLVIILVMAWKADQLFCGSRDIDINTEL